MLVWEDEHAFEAKNMFILPKTIALFKAYCVLSIIWIHFRLFKGNVSGDLQGVEKKQPRHQFWRVGCFETHYALWSAAAHDCDQCRWFDQDLRAECGDDAMGGAKVWCHQHVTWPFTTAQVIWLMFCVHLSICISSYIYITVYIYIYCSCKYCHKCIYRHI